MSTVDTILLEPTGRAAKGGRNIALLIVGYSLLLILVYLVVARKPIVDAIVGGSWIGSYAAKAWVAPVDPLAALGAGKPISSGASSSTSTGSTGPLPTPNAQGYVAPFAGATPERVDMGQDFALKPGAPIRAIGNAVIKAIQPNWYKGQPLIAYELTAGPAKGRQIYAAEQITPTVKVGQRVRAGQMIATYAAQGTGLETGWFNGKETLAQSTTGYTEGAESPAGKSFSNFLKQLGV